MTCAARQPQLAAALLLERRGHERRLRASDGTASRSTLRTVNVGAVEAVAQRAGPRLVEHDHVVAAGEPARSSKSLPGGDPRGRRAPTSVARERRASVGNAAVEVPVAGRHERHALALALDDQADRGALHPAGRQPAR